MDAHYQLSSPLCPLIITLSPGANPTDEIFKLASQKGMAKRVDSISFGQQQGPVALRAVEHAASLGNWILLQNCHFATSQLEKIVNSVVPDTVHPKFRMWLTSNPTVKFPVSILLVGDLS
jgi:dynein heavy chain